MEDESADIRKAAVAAVYGWDGRGLIGRDRAGLTDRVYRAIEQERERCATVLEGWGLANGAKALRAGAALSPAPSESEKK